ncbi:MAG: hypothetical protein HY017_18765 [Betaproteobacteria bacterium]|nr:hypothetical protein [Betaproteobacteria bacterium]
MLREIEGAIEDRTLVRAHVSAIRIKDLPSFQRKADRNGWNGDEAFARCGDVIGGRVVCNNAEDVYRFVELLKELLPGDQAAFEIQDWIKAPNQRGYRALHINFWLDVSDTFAPELVPCEVQVRTRLQDAWAELTHGDIYKQPGLPEDLRGRSRELSNILATADSIASAIRQRAVQEAVAPSERPDLRSISSAGLAFTFKEVFGRSPPDYLVRQALNLCEELEISSLEKLPETLGRPDFREEVGRAYRSIIGVRMGAEDVFLAALHAFAGGEAQAFKYVRRKARREFREIDRNARREMLSSLPFTVEELIAQLEDPQGEADVESWADALGATDSCSICGTTIVRPDAFAEALVQHYAPSNADDARTRIETALVQSSVERGGWDNSSLCSYHDERAYKD